MLDFCHLLDAAPRDDLGSRLREAVNHKPNESSAALDLFAMEVARRYNSGAMSFDDADAVLNLMHGAMCSGIFFERFYDSSRLAIQVFCAFDEGEYCHPGDDAMVDPVEKYTKPMIARILCSAQNS